MMKLTKIWQTSLVRMQLWLLLVPPLLYGIAVCTYPFGHVLAQKQISVSSLSTHQKLNIIQAARKIDGQIVRPGEEFSFNKTVGPRTERAGFYSAPSYVGTETFATTGGGICVVSSSLYQDALLAGLKVSQRVAHDRTMQTVEPGLDATVWFGGADLKFINDSAVPVRIECKLQDGYLKTVILSDKDSPEQITLSRKEMDGANNQIAVEVFAESGDHTAKLISRDLYTLTGRRTSIAKRNQASATSRTHV